MTGPLDGIQVLDLSRVLAGPWATQCLADLGADVIKVERPGSGDDTRGWGPPFIVDGAGRPTGDAAYFMAANRGKRSIAIDLAHGQGQALVRRLAQRADILVENYKHGDLTRYGLDYPALSAINPGLIFCSITGFGQTGPNAARAGYDFIIQAMAGLMSVTGSPETGPLRTGIAVSDITTGLYAVIAILAALNERHRSGLGQHIDMALFDVQAGWLANQAANYFASGQPPGLTGNTHPNIVPYQDFMTRDGRIIVAVGNDRQFARLCTILGAPEWAGEGLYARNAARLAARHTLVALIQERLLARDSAHWLAALDAAGIPCGPINDIAQVFASDQALARGLTVERPHGAGGTVKMTANPIRLSRTPVTHGDAPPLLGDDGAAILTELGLSDAEQQAFIDAGVVALPDRP